MLFDAHTHLNYEEYSCDERTEVAAEIEASDVGYIVDAADCVASARQALADAAAYPWCYAAVGIHPAHAARCTDKALETIRELAANPRVVAIGEIGLDYYYGTDDREKQQEVFRRQIRLACEFGLPIMVHSRDAHQMTMNILTEEGTFSEERKRMFPKRPAPGTLSQEAYGSDMKLKGAENGLADDARVQLHCFSGSPELAMEYIKLGATISLGGPVTFKNGRKAAETAREIPLEFLLSETDAPYLAPEPFRGRPNKSPYIEHTVRRIAMLKGISYEETARVLTENGKRFFNIK